MDTNNYSNENAPYNPTLLQRVVSAGSAAAVSYPAAEIFMHAGSFGLFLTIVGGFAGALMGPRLIHKLQASGLSVAIEKLQQTPEYIAATAKAKRQKRSSPISKAQMKIIEEFSDRLGKPVPPDLEEWTFLEAAEVIDEVQAYIEKLEIDSAWEEAERQSTILLQQETGQDTERLPSTPLPVETTRLLSSEPVAVMREDPFPVGQQRQQIEEVAARQKPPQAVYQQQSQKPAPSSAYSLTLGVRKDRTNRPVSLDLEKFFGEGAFIAGSQGSGKSSLLAMLYEKLSRLRFGGARLPLFILDWKGEYHSLAEYFGEFGLVAGFAESISGPAHPLELEDVAAFVADAVANGWQVVFDINSYALYEPSNPNSASGKAYGASIAAEIINELMKYAARLPVDQRPPVVVAVDEAHHLAPQKDDFSELASDITKKTKKAIFNAATTGRSFGITVIALTQRIQQIDKGAIQSLANKVIMRHTLSTDVTRCGEELGIGKATDVPDLQALPVGAAYVRGSAFGTEVPLYAQFEDRVSLHQSATPGLENLQRFYSGNKRNATPLVESVRAAEEEEESQEETTNVLQFQARTGTDNAPISQVSTLSLVDQAIVQYSKEGLSSRDMEEKIGLGKSAINERMSKLRAAGHLA